MLECSVNNHVSLSELLDEDSDVTVCITFTRKEKNAVIRALSEFVQELMAYDLHEMVSDEDMQEIVRDCESLRDELYR